MLNVSPLTVSAVARPHARGYCLKLFRAIQLSLVLNQNNGSHCTLLLGIGPLSVSVGLGLWDKFLPR